MSKFAAVLRHLDDYLEVTRRSSGATLARFSKSLADDPREAFENSLQAMEAAADMFVCGRVAKLAASAGDRQLVIGEVRILAHKEVCRMARYPRHSTAAPSNIMHTETLAAWARVLEIVDVE